MARDASIQEIEEDPDEWSRQLADGLPEVLADELGAELMAILTRARAAHEAWERRLRSDEGLRERKKRLTRQRISDVATALFTARGFENVRVSEVAEVVGVSEKTIYNYFPTKEAMVFDMADEGIERLVAALRVRAPGESPTKAVVGEIRRDIEQLEFVLGEDAHKLLPLFAEMIDSTPALRAAWRGIEERLVVVIGDELATAAQVDPRDPEPRIAALALAGLHQISWESQWRRVQEGFTGRSLIDAILADVDRAARVLEVGMWSLDLLVQGDRSRRQLQAAAKAAEQARLQVGEAIAHARVAWNQIRVQEQDRKRGGKTRQDRRGELDPAGRQAAREAARAGREALRAAREAKRSLREVKRPRGPGRPDRG
jgi:AcrR family transcriptional regulator